MPFSTWQSDILHLFKRLNALREKKIIKNFAIQYIILTCTSCKEIWVNICVIQIHIFFTCIFPLTHKQYTLVSLGGRQPGLSQRYSLDELVIQCYYAKLWKRYTVNQIFILFIPFALRMVSR